MVCHIGFARYKIDYRTRSFQNLPLSVMDVYSTVYELQRCFSFPGAPSQCFARWQRSANSCQAATGYKLFPKLSNHTKILEKLPNGKLSLLPNGTKTLQDLLIAGKALRVFYPPKPTIMSIYGLRNPCQLTEKRQSAPNQKLSSTVRPNIFTRKSASEHSFSGKGCNIRVFQGIFPRAKKVHSFSGSFSVFRVCWPPWLMITTMMTIASTSYNCSRQQSSAGITNVNQQWFHREGGLREISRILYLIDFLTHLNSM